MLAEAGADGHALRKALLDMVGTHGEPRWSGVVAAILNREKKTRITPGSAAIAVRRTLASELAPYLVERLAERGERLLVRDALVSLGDVGFRALADVISNDEAPIRLKSGRARDAAFGSQEAVDLLTELDRERASRCATVCCVCSAVCRRTRRKATSTSSSSIGRVRSRSPAKS
jgi:hypothetical protein